MCPPAKARNSAHCKCDWPFHHHENQSRGAQPFRDREKTGDGVARLGGTAASGSAKPRPSRLRISGWSLPRLREVRRRAARRTEKEPDLIRQGRNEAGGGAGPRIECLLRGNVSTVDHSVMRARTSATVRLGPESGAWISFAAARGFGRDFFIPELATKTFDGNVRNADQFDAGSGRDSSSRPPQATSAPIAGDRQRHPAQGSTASRPIKNTP